jgi:hypothetical protein
MAAKIARAGGASVRVEECLEHIEASLRELHAARAANHAILEQLWDHLMGSLDIKDYDIHSLSRARGSPSERSTLALGSMDHNSRRQSRS